MVPDVSSATANDALAKNRVKVSWLFSVIALTGVAINVIYFGIEILSVADRSSKISATIFTSIYSSCL